MKPLAFSKVPELNFSEKTQKEDTITQESLIGSQVLDLFTLKSAIKDKTILCIPFSLKIPKEFPASINHHLDLDHKDNVDIKGLNLKRL